MISRRRTETLWGKAQMPVEHQPPDVLAMILADTVLRDCVTGKAIIHGIYSHIFANEFPVTYPAIVVYAAITNGHGKTELELRIVDADEEMDPLISRKGMADFPDPLVVAEAILAVGPVVFPTAGEYRIQLFGAGQLIRERRLQVMPVPMPPAQ
jgi:hypothetical protein